MRTLFHLRWLLALLLTLGGHSVARASHLLGGDIAYRPVAPTTAGVPRYHVTVRLFLVVVAYNQTSITLVASQGPCGSGGGQGFQVTIPRSSSTPGTWANCTVPSSSAYYASLYETDVDLPVGLWTLAAIGENRQDQLANVPNSVATTFYVSTTLDNTLTTQNTSPTFESNTLPLLTNVGPQRYSFSAFDADGDSLAYAVAPVQSFSGGLSNWTPGACPTALPGGMSPHFTLDARSGALLRSTGNGGAQAGYYVMAARVSEYRRLAGQWQLLGTVTRDVVYLVINAANQPPTITTAAVDGSPAQLPEQPVYARPGQTVQLTLTAADPDAGQQLTFLTNATVVVPGLGLVAVSPTQAQLTWRVPATLPPGRYHVPVTVLDNGCPYSASEDRTLTFVVTNQVLGTRAAAASALPAAWPTPFREQVQFAAPAGQPVLVVDARGRPVAQLLAGPDGLVRWLPAPGLAPGLYLARSPAGAPLARLLHAE